MITPRSVGTHDGTFHADEVTACALLLAYDLIDRDKIIRTRLLEKLACCEFVCDVGGEYDPSKKRFDHHQASYKGNFSSAGMVLLYLKKTKIIDPVTYGFLNHSFVIGVDAHDNGKGTLEPGFCSFSQVISNFVPIHYDVFPNEQDEAFHQALNFVLGHIQRLLSRFAYAKECKAVVQEAMDKREDHLFFSQSMPWIDSFFELNGESHPAKFIIMPAAGQWKLRGIPPSNKDRMKVRKPLPKEWAGLLEDELKQVSQIPGAVFCHKGLFISVWKTKEDAFKAMEYALSTKTAK